MFGVTVDHQVAPGNEADAHHHMNRQAERMSVCNGFVARFNLTDESDAAHVTTVTLWETRVDYEGWIAIAREGGTPPASLWDRPTVRAFFEVEQPV
jgi:heme-degrading monooxygenase HmoA